MLFPAIFGFSCWFLLGSFSIVYSVVNCLWGIIFIEYWKRQEVDLSCRWQTKDVSVVRSTRREFKAEKEIRDEGTGELKGVFSARKRMVRQLLQVPFVLFSAVALGVIIATCFAIEIFISEVYNGPFKTYLVGLCTLMYQRKLTAQVFIPTVLLSSLVPTMSALLASIATTLNDYENYETQHAYDVALTQKIFVINFVTSYLPIFLTAFVYIPFAGRIVPYLDVFGLTVRPFVSKEKVTSRSEFSIDPARLKKQVIYFTVTAQIVNFGTETIVPFLKQHFFRKYKAFSQERAVREDSDNTSAKTAPASFDDPAEEGEFLTRVRNAAELSEYDVTDDLREMCIQFGYLALFSPTWPLVPVSFLVNNWVELRSDLFKICVECRRPAPQRSDTIGPWLDSLGFLSWVGSITSASLVYMFSNGHSHPNGEPSTMKGWALLLTIFFSEHIYLIVRYAVRAAMAKLEPPSSRKERAERFRIRKRYLDSALRAATDESEESEKPTVEVADISRPSLEDDARSSTIHTTDLAERFWTRQKGWSESAKVSAGIIQNRASRTSKKQQ